MPYVGGDIIEIVCNHPTLGSFRFQPKASEPFTQDAGGIRSNDEASSVTASGLNIIILNNTRWSVDCQVATDFKNDTEVNPLNLMAADPQDGVWTMSHASGSIKKGTGRPVGDINSDTGTAMTKFKLAGGGKLEEIS